MEINMAAKIIHRSIKQKKELIMTNIIIAAEWANHYPITVNEGLLYSWEVIKIST